MATTVVNIKHEPCTVYIGRAPGAALYHYGNPFSHMRNTLAAVKVASREESISCFKDWLDRVRFLDIEPERRDWILDHIEELKDETLGCFCKPLSCHGDILAEYADRTGSPPGSLGRKAGK